MNARFLLAFAGFFLIVGSGSLWLYYKTIKRKQFVKNLLSLPKERRFFWYKLRKADFSVISHNLISDFSVLINGNKNNFSLKIDFLVKRNRIRYAALFSPKLDDKEVLKLFFVYSNVFRVNGVIFYDEDSRDLSIWEK